MNIGKTIKELRKAAGLNQHQLGETSGITQTYLSLIESGVRNPHFDTIKAIATGLKTSVAAIYVQSIDADDLKVGSTEQGVFLMQKGKELLLSVL